MYHDDSFGSAFKRGYRAIPIAIRSILTICVVMFFLMILGGQAFATFLVEYFAFIPDPITTFTQPWRLVTYMFLHGGFLHIIFNMLWLWWMGRPVEEQLGPKNFLVLFFGAGIGGALINTALSGVFGAGPTIGASGAVLGIMVTFAVMFPRMPIMLIFLPPIEARFIVAGLVLIDLLLIGQADNIARIVHLGGALTGYVLIKMYYRGYHYDLWIEQITKSFSGKKKAGASSSSGAGSAFKGARRKDMHAVSDAEVLDEQEEGELDRILDKISKQGYEGLSDREKKILFELSKRN